MIKINKKINKKIEKNSKKRSKKLKKCRKNYGEKANSIHHTNDTNYSYCFPSFSVIFKLSTFFFLS